LGDINRVAAAQPPPAGVNAERYREFITEILNRASDVGRYTDAL